jgi:Xaa-Pro aminopeptidase
MKKSITETVAAFRSWLKREQLQALYISGTDPHRSEYLSDHWLTRKHATGFTGSFGEVVITASHAGLWTDTRYFLQAEEQLKDTGITLHKLRVPQAVTVAEWLYGSLREGDKVAVDPFSLPLETFRSFDSVLPEKNIEIVPMPGMLDTLWTDRPSLPRNPVFEMDLKYSGMTRQEKFAKVEEILALQGCDLTLVTALDDLAWTYNLRGSDVPYNPVFYSFAILGPGLNLLFTNRGRVPDDVAEKLRKDAVTILDYTEIIPVLSSIQGKTVWLDPGNVSTALWMAVREANRVKEGISIPGRLKAVKNGTEQNGFRQAMIKDGVAMVEFLHWMDDEVKKGTLTEFLAGRKVAEFRAKQENFEGESFPPIVGYGDHGAIVHLSVDESNTNTIRPDGVLLIDSGGHYLHGTTDITRTVAIGPVSSRQKRDFTLVLKGMIALTEAVFPEGAKGMNLDFLARRSLNREGLNYGHGTGHGVGHYLSVHEGPAAIRQEFNPVEIGEGMIFTNEPGLYRKDEYGIRTENMMVCVEKQTTGFGKFLGFETLTLCPIDLSLVETGLLSGEEKAWLNQYHARVRLALSPYLPGDMTSYLTMLTREI